jgi:RNA polymerase-binding transcription factor DksA
MTEKTKKELKELLEKEMSQLQVELGSVGRINPSNPNDWEAVPDKIDIVKADPNEVADGIVSYEDNAGILKQLEIRFNEVKNALLRLEKGTYGICEVCRKEIDAKRLEANPAATTCIEHMSKTL